MKDNDNLIKDITRHLDESADTLDPEILSQIRAARYNALEKKRPGIMQWAFPAGGIAAAAVALIVAVNLVTVPENNSNPDTIKFVETVDKPEPGRDETVITNSNEMEIQPDQIELVEILSSDQQLDFFENLEFYAWLAENEDITG